MTDPQPSENADENAERNLGEIELNGEELADDQALESEDIEETDKLDESQDEDDEQHALEIRRAIEDHVDRSRLQKEIDYLFDEGFTEGEGEEEQKED